MCYVQADNHQENLVIAEAGKVETDGLVNFIIVNEVRYMTEYNQVVGPPAQCSVEACFSPFP